MDNIIQLKITLKGTKPPIWRRLLVDKSMTFSQFHYIIITTMGWDGGHLYEFIVNGQRVGELYNEDDGWGGKLVDASRKSLGSLITDTKEKIEYTYDFGDSWEHLITIEKFKSPEDGVKYPFCIDGKLCCPPEDCGGVYGFYELLEAIKNKNHPDHENMIEWIGEEYDPEYFDIEQVNKKLRQLFTGTRKK